MVFSLFLFLLLACQRCKQTKALIQATKICSSMNRLFVTCLSNPQPPFIQMHIHSVFVWCGNFLTKTLASAVILRFKISGFFLSSAASRCQNRVISFSSFRILFFIETCSTPTKWSRCTFHLEQLDLSEQFCQRHRLFFSREFRWILQDEMRRFFFSLVDLVNIGLKCGQIALTVIYSKS